MWKEIQLPYFLDKRQYKPLYQGSNASHITGLVTKVETDSKELRLTCSNCKKVTEWDYSSSTKEKTEDIFLYMDKESMIDKLLKYKCPSYILCSPGEYPAWMRQNRDEAINEVEKIIND